MPFASGPRWCWLVTIASSCARSQSGPKIPAIPHILSLLLRHRDQVASTLRLVFDCFARRLDRVNEVADHAQSGATRSPDRPRSQPQLAIDSTLNRVLDFDLLKDRGEERP